MDSGTKLTVNIGAIARNYAALDLLARQGGARSGAVVKAGGYGLGARKLVGALARAGCEIFFVATGSEGQAIREELGQNGVIYVLHGCPVGQEVAFAEAGLRPVLHSLAGIRRWADCHEAGRVRGCAIQLETGMNRLGLDASELRHVLADRRLSEAAAPHLLLSHLACAEDRDAVMNEQQRQEFVAMLTAWRETIGPIAGSLANSAGMFLGAHYQFEITRPGIALFGGLPDDTTPGYRLHPTVTLEGRVMQVRALAADAVVGYGAAPLHRRTRLATVATGYADGLLRGCSSRLVLRIAGAMAPVLGRVSMDSILVDITDVPESSVEPDSYLPIIGPGCTIHDVARAAETIPHDVLTSLRGKRIDRVWVDAPDSLWADTGPHPAAAPCSEASRCGPAIAAIAARLTDDPRLRIHRLAQYQHNQLAGAARRLAEGGDAACAILTGFHLPHAEIPTAESDGPIGAVMVAEFLVRVGIGVQILTDANNAGPIDATLAAAGLPPSRAVGRLDADGSGILAEIEAGWQRSGMGLLISIERPGPAEDGRLHNMRGEDVTDYHAPIHRLWEAASVDRIAIGDGGNELGMGLVGAEVIARVIENGEMIACRSLAEHLILAGVSNWGAMGLVVAAALYRPGWREAASAVLAPGRHDSLLGAFVAGGGRDGVTLRAEQTVDGLAAPRHEEMMRFIRDFLEK